jgi:hypothetical protein
MLLVPFKDNTISHRTIVNVFAECQMFLTKQSQVCSLLPISGLLDNEIQT